MDKNIMENFWKLFLTLFGIGAAITFAKSIKSKKDWKEIISECIIGGAVTASAGVVYLIYPSAPFIAIAGVGMIAAILGVAFLSDKLEFALGKLADKYLTKKEG